MGKFPLNQYRILSNTIIPLFSSTFKNHLKKYEISFCLFNLFTESEHAEVKCKNTTADRGGRFVNLQCTISLHGITCASQIYWENGNTGEKINTTGGLFKVSCEVCMDVFYLSMIYSIKGKV